MKLLLSIVFIQICCLCFSQQHATEYTHCQLKVDEILLQQSFDIDDPKSEEARHIFFDLFESLNAIYKKASEDKIYEEEISEFENTIEKATLLKLNLEMFDEDIKAVSKLKK